MRNENEKNCEVAPDQSYYGAKVSKPTIEERRNGASYLGDENVEWVPHTFNIKITKKIQCNTCSFVQPPK